MGLRLPLYPVNPGPQTGSSGGNPLQGSLGLEVKALCLSCGTSVCEGTENLSQDKRRQVEQWRTTVGENTSGFALVVHEPNSDLVSNSQLFPIRKIERAGYDRSRSHSKVSDGGEEERMRSA